jgi:hypothetical protein
MNRFPAWRAGPTAIFDIPAINSLESIPWLLKRSQIRALLIKFTNSTMPGGTLDVLALASTVRGVRG